MATTPQQFKSDDSLLVHLLRALIRPLNFEGAHDLFNLLADKMWYWPGYTPGGCVRAASSQAGLVSERIQPRQGAGSVAVGVEIERNALLEDDTCFALFCIIIHGCLEKVLTCVNREDIAVWAAPLALEFDFVRFYEHMWAREGWRSHSLIPHTGIDCKEVLRSARPDPAPRPERGSDWRGTGTGRKKRGMDEGEGGCGGMALVP
jgi:hypothetical protein